MQVAAGTAHTRRCIAQTRLDRPYQWMMARRLPTTSPRALSQHVTPRSLLPRPSSLIGGTHGPRSGSLPTRDASSACLKWWRVRGLATLGLASAGLAVASPLPLLGWRASCVSSTEIKKQLEIQIAKELAEDLCKAAENGALGYARKLLDEGADPNAKQEGELGLAGHSALSLAINNGHIKIVELLLQRGARVTVRGPLGWTPLHFAALYACFHPTGHSIEMVELLLLHGAPVRLKDKAGFTPLQTVVASSSLASGAERWLDGLEKRVTGKSSGSPRSEELVELAKLRSNKLACVRLLLKADAGAFGARTQEATYADSKGEFAIAALILDPSLSDQQAIAKGKLREARHTGLADKELETGTRLHISPYGNGTYKGFKKNTIGANEHVVHFDKGGLLAVRLRDIDASKWSVLEK